MPSPSFDRAADFYDDTRGFPPGIDGLVADAAVELIPGPRVLEVGIGTGRIARPLLERGVSVSGADLSRKMMQRLVAALPAGVSAPPLAQADAALLPFASGVFDGVVSVHVFHLIANWHEALSEARRVLRNGGIFLAGYEWRPQDSPGQRIMHKWREIVRSRGMAGEQVPPGSQDFEDIKAVLSEMGARMEERSVGEWTRTRTLSRHLESIEHRTWSSTWRVPEAFFPDCLAELRAWAAAEFGGEETEFTTPHRFIWQRFSWKE